MSAFRLKEGRSDLAGEVTVDGDGAVLAAHAVPVLPLAHERLDSRAGHVELMADREVLQAIARFLARP